MPSPPGYEPNPSLPPHCNPKRSVYIRPYNPRHPSRRIQRINVFGFGGLATGVIICCMNQVKSNASFIIFSAIFGFCSGTIISRGSAVIIMVLKSPQVFGRASYCIK